MKQKLVLPLLLMALLALALFPINAGSVAAQDDDAINTITVNGFGTAHAAPDVAIVSVTIDTTNDDVAIAVNDANSRVEAVMASLATFDIPQADIRTDNFYIYREAFYGPEGPTGEGTFHVSNMLSVTARDTEVVSQILAAVLEAGATGINGVSFTIEDSDALESEARSSAVDEARAVAAELAALTGVSVGDVVAISELGGGGGPLFNQFGFGGGGGGGGGIGAPPIEGGALAVSVSVQVTFELVR
jgi:uncharacterized protein YggE